MSAARVLKEETVPTGTAPAFTGVVYGPEHHPLLQRVIGVNILGTGQKACSFDCNYCDLGRTSLRLNRLKNEINFPTPAEVAAELEKGFSKIHAVGPTIDAILLSGNGEPTLHPDFPEIVKVLLAARDQWLPTKPIGILSNGAGLDTRKITDAMNLLNERIIKIDAGNERAFKAMAAPLSRTTLSRVLLGARKLKDITIQSLFHKGVIDNTVQSDIDDWLEVVAMIRPKAVHIQGINRPAAQEGLIRCDEDTLYSIASRLERKTQIKAVVTP